MSTSESFTALPTSVLSRVFDLTTLVRAKEIEMKGKILSFKLHEEENAYRLEGKVLGSRGEVYDTEVWLHRNAQGGLESIDGDCSCPVSIDCKHSAALIFHWGKNNASQAAPGAAGARAKAKGSNSERARINNQLTRWLNDYEQVRKEPTSGELIQIPVPETSDKEERALFTLRALTNQEASTPQLALGFGYTRMTRKGTWVKLRAPKSHEMESVSTEVTEILGLINSLPHVNQRYTGFFSGYRPEQTEGIFRGASGLLALEMAARNLLLHWCPEEKEVGTLLRLGPRRELCWHWVRETDPNLDEDLWRLQATLAPLEPLESGGHDADAMNSESAILYATQPPLYVDPVRGEVGHVISPGLSDNSLKYLFNAPPMPHSAFEDEDSVLLDLLAGLPLPPSVPIPEVYRDIRPTAEMHVQLVPASLMRQCGLLYLTLCFNYAQERHFWPHHNSPVLTRKHTDPDSGAGPGQRIQIHRDLAFEQAAMKAWGQLGLLPDDKGQAHLPFISNAQQQQFWLPLLDNDFANLRAAGWEIYLAPELQGWLQRADELLIQIQAPTSETPQGDAELGDEAVSATISPWFNLSLGINIEGQRYNILPWLPDLIAQIRTHSRYVSTEQADGSVKVDMALPEYVFVPRESQGYLRLPTEPIKPWLQVLLELVGDRSKGDLNAESLRLSRIEAMRLSASLGDGVSWQGVNHLRDMLKQLTQQGQLPHCPPATELKAELRPYQQQGLNWLQFLSKHHLAGILADDMGLGKTLQTLAHIQVEHHQGRLKYPALVVAPVSVLSNWQREAQRFTPDLRTLVHHGQDRHELDEEFTSYQIVITSYSLLQRDRERWLSHPWHLLVLDEAQNIKNANTQAAQMVRELNANHRLCLSGTPMENHLGEMWSLFHFLMPGFLGSQTQFKEQFRTPIEQNNDTERLTQLRQRVTPFVLRRHKKEVAQELPDKIESLRHVVLEGDQADLYETIRLTTEQAVREALSSQGLAKSQIQILDALLKLRQVCCDPRLVPTASARKVKKSAKLEQLMEMLPEMIEEGRRILLFSQFTSMLELIEKELPKHNIQWTKLTGQSTKRDEIIQQFTSGEVPLFLISLKTGGVGLNLTQADTVIHYDPWWNPAVENQATDRAHRIGQTNQVFVYKLVAQGTIEERILALQERKAALAQSMYSGSQARKQPLFTEDDVAELLKPISSFKRSPSTRSV